MTRLTTDSPHGNFETMMNFVYRKYGLAHIRFDGESEDVLLTDWAQRQCWAHGCGGPMTETPEEIDQRLCDCMMDDPSCPIAMAYCFASQAVHLRDRLKMYEDTGLEPEKIYRERFLIVERKDPEKLARLRVLVDADADERLVVLPCKVGDTVWANYSMAGDRYKAADRPYPVDVVFIGMGEKKGFLHVQYSNGRVFPFDFDQIGKVIFLTREEAKVALRKRE